MYRTGIVEKKMDDNFCIRIFHVRLNVFEIKALNRFRAPFLPIRPPFSKMADFPQMVKFGKTQDMLRRMSGTHYKRFHSLISFFQVHPKKCLTTLHYMEDLGLTGFETWPFLLENDNYGHIFD